jgi:hypothetical protein
MSANASTTPALFYLARDPALLGRQAKRASEPAGPQDLAGALARIDGASRTEEPMAKGQEKPGKTNKTKLTAKEKKQKKKEKAAKK